MYPVFAVGQRVSRRIDAYDSKSPFRFGNVIRRYSRLNTRYGDYPELYEVQWDDGSIGRAYLPHGLTAIREKRTPPVRPQPGGVLPVGGS